MKHISIKRVRELRIKIKNEAVVMDKDAQWDPEDTGYNGGKGLYAKT
jgi:hypothetical protein